VYECDWSKGQLGSLAGVALGKLTLYGTKGVTSADVAAFAEGVAAAGGRRNDRRDNAGQG
jgi:hypothetical protein